MSYYSKFFLGIFVIFGSMNLNAMEFVHSIKDALIANKESAQVGLLTLGILTACDIPFLMGNFSGSGYLNAENQQPKTIGSTIEQSLHKTVKMNLPAAGLMTIAAALCNSSGNQILRDSIKPIVIALGLSSIATLAITGAVALGLNYENKKRGTSFSPLKDSLRAMPLVLSVSTPISTGVAALGWLGYRCLNR